MNEEKIINGVLHKHTELGWIPYSQEELTLMLQLEKNHAEAQYVRGQRDALQEHVNKMKSLHDRLFQQQPTASLS